MSLDTTPSYKSPQMPFFSLVILPLDLVTVIYLMELLKDVLKAIKAIFSTTNTPKATKP
jgi:hypothetical protein